MKNLFILTISVLLLLISCKKNQNKINNEKSQDSLITNQKVTAPKPFVKVDSIIVSQNEIGMGCVTEYSDKLKINQMIFMQAGAKDQDAWISIMKLNGKREIFINENESTVSDGENGFIINLENKNYKIVIKAKVGKTHIEADSTEASGVITITPKSNDFTETTIDFVGGTAC